MAKKMELSLSSQKLNYKLKIAFYLMSLLPLLICVYLVSNYILPSVGIKLYIGVPILVSMVVAGIGYLLVQEVFKRVLSVCSDAKSIADGDIDHPIEVAHADEVGDLSKSLNQLKERIRCNMDELNSYSEKTNEINQEIHKRVTVLSGLLQISSLISQGMNLQEVLKIIVIKSRLLAHSDAGFLLLRKDGQELFCVTIVDGTGTQYLLDVNIWSQEEIFNKLIMERQAFILDKEHALPDNVQKYFYEKFKLKNSLAMPVCLKGVVIGILGIGSSSETFVYEKDDIELLDIFAKQIAIAVDNDLLVHRVEKLEIKDILTGLYNEAFIRNRLQEEIKRAIAYQRPCAFILLIVDNFHNFHKKFGPLQVEAVLKKLAFLIRSSVTEIDYVARFGDDKFAVVLPESNKRKSLEIAENIRKKIEFTFSEEQDSDGRVTVSASISENPLDGIAAEELIDKAKSLLSFANIQGKNRISI
jgi:diguanylate cyclase (GGDEF)-like protein